MSIKLKVSSEDKINKALLYWLISRGISDPEDLINLNSNQLDSTSKCENTVSDNTLSDINHNPFEGVPQNHFDIIKNSIKKLESKFLRRNQ